MNPGTYNPVQVQYVLRKLMKGVVGGQGGEDQLHRLERIAARAIQARRNLEKRRKNLAEQSRLRAEAVDRRVRGRMLAAQYARDRRASGTTRTLSKRQERRLRTEERIAQKREKEALNA